jgi:predicted ATPase/class 3 adenylate cyclase/DNA-binding CsgD family transcriptional regulator
MAWTDTPLMWGEPPAGADLDAGPRFHLPAGTVTFLLSDIEGSTRLWATHPEAMGEAVAQSYAILDGAIGSHEGVRPIEQGEGDSVVGAFSRASAALAAALQAQRELHAHAWPGGIALRVRIALHTADAQLRDEGNYFGLALARCARLRAIARGGQTLLSRATRDLVVDRLPAGVALVDRGLHRLRDLGRPEHVFVMVHDDLSSELGVLRSLDAFPNNLPDQLTSFVGRQAELTELRRTLSESRLVTLTGAGGAGKTRLSLQLAADALEQFPDGAWWVNLAPVSEPDQVAEVLASALGVRPLPAMTSLQACCAHLAGARALVMLDNCEHLLVACGESAEALLRGCPEVTVLATSRTPLGVAGETDWRIPSLSLPAQRAEGAPRQPLEGLAQSDAVRLFIERARKARHNFTVTNDNAPAVAQICQKLDGLPLAIELAAARVRMLSAEQIAAGLGDRFRLLTGGTRTALPRQQTLRASVDWSHELLSDTERRLLRRLAVFAGGFTLDLAEATAADDQLERVAVLDTLASLVDKSLVVAEERGPAVRYRLLETVRQYATERLHEAGEAAALADRHRDALLAMAESIGEQLHGSEQAHWLSVLDAESANLAAALERAADTDGELALRLCIAMTFWWRWRGLFGPAERGFVRALDSAGPQPTSLRARVLWGRGYLAGWAANLAVSLDSLQQARTMAEELGDRSTLARTLAMIGFLQIFPDPVGSRATNLEARALAQACDDDWAIVIADINIAFTYLHRHELDEGERVLEDLIARAEQLHYVEMRAWYWLGRCFRPFGLADAERVWELVDRAVKADREDGEPSTWALAQCFAALLEIARGDPQAAIERLEPTRARLIAAGAGLILGPVEGALAVGRATLGDAVEGRRTLESMIDGGMDGGYLLATALASLAEVLRVAGEVQEAQRRARDAATIAERIGLALALASAHETLGRLALIGGDLERAEALAHEALAVREQLDLRLFLPQTLDLLAQIACELDSHEEAARILGAAQGTRAMLGLRRWAPDEPTMTRVGEVTRAALGDEVFERALVAGERLPLADAVTWVRGARGSRRRPEHGWQSLTPTEERVVALVAEGLTNPQIGERMFISRGTVKVHLSHIFAKLNVATRSELSAAATRRSLAAP